MSYSDFTLDKVRKEFNLTLSDRIDIFSDTPELKCSEILRQILRDNVPLALASNTEKSRSEMIIAPILIELRKQLNYQISLFSGIDFTVEPAKGLNLDFGQRGNYFAIRNREDYVQLISVSVQPVRKCCTGSIQSGFSGRVSLSLS